jgi:hypothetical protein
MLVGLLATGAAAQGGITVSVLVAGAESTVTYTGPAPDPNDPQPTVTICFDDGRSDGEQTVTVPLGPNGTASFRWLVPYWEQVHISAPNFHASFNTVYL